MPQPSACNQCDHQSDDLTGDHTPSVYTATYCNVPSSAMPVGRPAAYHLFTISSRAELTKVPQRERTCPCHPAYCINFHDRCMHSSTVSPRSSQWYVSTAHHDRIDHGQVYREGVAHSALYTIPLQTLMVTGPPGRLPHLAINVLYGAVWHTRNRAPPSYSSAVSVMHGGGSSIQCWHHYRRAVHVPVP